MKVKNNHINIVALGCFNPAILTPDFLEDKCKFEVASKPKGKGTPIVTEINYGSISFALDLERFVIRHEDITDFLDTPIINVMIDYLNVLEYTPLHAIGVNLNYSVTDTKVENILKEFQENSKRLMDSMKLLEGTSTCEIHRKSDEPERLIEFDISGSIDENTVERLKITLQDESLRINHNHEIRNLQNNRNLFKRIKQDHQSFVKNDKILRETFFKE